MMIQVKSAVNNAYSEGGMLHSSSAAKPVVEDKQFPEENWHNNA